MQSLATNKIFGVALAVSAALMAMPAAAAPIILNLTGTVSSGTTATVTSGGQRFDFFQIQLDGLTPFSVVEGDEIAATVTLDTALVVSTADIRNGVGFFLQPTDYQIGPSTAVEGTFELFDGGVSLFGPVADNTLTSGQLAASYGNFGVDTYSFDSFQSNFKVTSLGGDPTLQLGLASFYIFTVNRDAGAVPEPASWAMMIIGFGAVGGALRSRRSARIATA